MEQTTPRSESEFGDSENTSAAALTTRSGSGTPDGFTYSGCYGELILLGYNGNLESGRSNSHGKRHRSKMVFKRRDEGNGIKRERAVEIKAPPKDSQLIRDSSRHVVSYSYEKSRTVLVEYSKDHSKDMFQIGRSSEEQIDFTLVDTWLAAAAAAGSNGVLSPAGNSTRNPRGGHHDDVGAKPISSTISRYACRILVDRFQQNNAYIFAAGFDTSKNIFLGEKATKWRKKNGDFDGLTTNGVLILHPDIHSEDLQKSEMYVWKEVSVDGDIYSLRETRSSMKRGDLVPNETNQLQDGTLIDLCGATLLWRSADGLSQSPSKAELDRRLDELNAGKPQCPVNLNTLVIPRKKRETHSARQPYVYMECGHVQGKHNWGVNETGYRCPICMNVSDKVIKLAMGMEPAFHLDSAALDHAFNPCGHVASHRTVSYWSRIPLPHGTNSFYPVCPFCTTLLATVKPWVRLIYQDHCYDS